MSQICWNWSLSPSKEFASRNISQINTKANVCTVIPSEINDIFKNFYSKLYTSESPGDNTDMLNFLRDLQFPTLHPAKCESIEQPLQLNEVVESISAMQSGKSPGPDGYPIEFYKVFSSKLAPLLLDMIVDSLTQGSLPQTLTEASISLILKPDKDPLNCSSYRPISLLNTDYKILAKTLTSRLEKVVPDIISTDQTGFMKDRHSSS